MPILNYTTSVPAASTITAITKTLVKAGARRVVTTYDGPTVGGLEFTIQTPHGEREYVLPVAVDGVQAALKRDKSLKPSQRTIAQAERVAWRIAKVWLDAQVALIEAGMASLDQVMLPYMAISADRTIYDAYVEREQAAITGSAS